MHEQGNISIHTENIFPIIKKSLYSDREIFLRELISNGVDAISKLKWIGYREDIPEMASTPFEINSRRKISRSEYRDFLIIGKIFSVWMLILPCSCMRFNSQSRSSVVLRPSSR